MNSGDSGESGGIKKTSPAIPARRDLKNKPAYDSADPSEFRDRRRRVGYDFGDPVIPVVPGPASPNSKSLRKKVAVVGTATIFFYLAGNSVTPVCPATPAIPKQSEW